MHKIHSQTCVIAVFLSPQPAEGRNDVLLWLKTNKENLGEGMKELRKKNEELEREKEEGEKERERMRHCIDQLRAKLVQAQVTLRSKPLYT